MYLLILKVISVVNALHLLRPCKKVPAPPGDRCGSPRSPPVKILSQLKLTSASRGTIAPAMRFGLFYLPSSLPTTRAEGSERLRAIMEQAGYAEQLGFDSIWLAEHHFHSFGGLFSATPVIGAAIAQKTTPASNWNRGDLTAVP